MPTWCADSSAVVMRSLLPQVPTLAEALVQYGWIMWSAKARRPLSHTVSILVLDKITAATERMPALFV